MVVWLHWSSCTSYSVTTVWHSYCCFFSPFSHRLHCSGAPCPSCSCRQRQQGEIRSSAEESRLFPVSACFVHLSVDWIMVMRQALMNLWATLRHDLSETNAAGETWRRPGIVENNVFFFTFPKLSCVLRFFKPHFWQSKSPFSKYNLSQMVTFWRLANESGFYWLLFAGAEQIEVVPGGLIVTSLEGKER